MRAEGAGGELVGDEVGAASGTLVVVGVGAEAGGDCVGACTGAGVGVAVVLGAGAAVGDFLGEAAGAVPGA